MSGQGLLKQHPPSGGSLPFREPVLEEVPLGKTLFSNFPTSLTRDGGPSPISFFFCLRGMGLKAEAGEGGALETHS